MKRLAIAAACAALALLTFFQFPGHTWLQQDSQIYVPILEHLRDPSVLRNDMLAEYPHVAFTLYDEAALGLRALTGLDFREVLAFQQILTRALGIWGLYLMATALGLATGPALLVASICSLGASIAGPEVLTIEYEPTPRAFAVPLLVCAMGLAAHRRYLGAGIAAGCAFLYHPPTALPFWGLWVFLGGRDLQTPSSAVCASWWGRRFRLPGLRGRSQAAGGNACPTERTERTKSLGVLTGMLAPLAAAAVFLALAAWSQGGGEQARSLFTRLTALQQQVQHLRAPYVWISTWPRALAAHHLLLAGIALAAFARIRREIPFELRVFLLGLPALALAAMPVSWLLLDHWKWALLPQWQPLRTLLFVALSMQFLTAAAGVSAAVHRRTVEAFAWFALAYLLPLQPVLTASYSWRRAGVVLALALIAALSVRLLPWRGGLAAAAAGIAAFFAVPLLGGVVNYPRLDTPEMAQLSAWARCSTPRDAVFFFAGDSRGLDPGLFRAEALRAVYVDWKGGGQVNFIPEFAGQWLSRRQQTGAVPSRPADLAKLGALGIDYVVLKAGRRLPGPRFENAAYAVYRTTP